MGRVDHWADVRDRSVKPLFPHCSKCHQPLPDKKPDPIPDGQPAVLTEITNADQAVSVKEALIERLYSEIEEVTAAKGPHLGHRIARAIAKLHRISFTDLCSHRRAAHLVAARQHAMYEIKKNTKMSLPAIGKILGGRDHTTIIHGIKQHEKRLKEGSHE
jgi:chromosomal replication initiation ATPase DnaA